MSPEIEFERFLDSIELKPPNTRPMGNFLTAIPVEIETWTF
jgi:hypothetical protein